MASTSFARLHGLLASEQDLEAIPSPSVFAPTTVFEPPPQFPSTLLKNNLFANQVSDAVATKLAELAPSSRKQTFLREVGYVGHWAEKVAYLTKKDTPVLQPLEIRLESEILFLDTIRYDWASLRKPRGSGLFFTFVTATEMHCYEARPIDHEEFDLEPSFTVDAPAESCVTSVLSTRTKRVFCATNKGEVYELRTELKDRHPAWVCIGDAELTTSPVKALRLDEEKGLIFALHQDSVIAVFLYRPNNSELSRRVSCYRPDSAKCAALMDVFPMTGASDDTAKLVAISSKGEILNFELDLRYLRRSVSFVKKFLRTAPSLSPSLRLSQHSQHIAERLEAAGESEILFAGYFDGLVVAMSGSEDGNPFVEFYTASRLPSAKREGDSGPSDPSRTVLSKEPLRLDGNLISMHVAADDDNTRLFGGLDLGRDELTRQVFLKGNKLVVLTDSQIVDLRKRCPVEVLMEILQVHDPERVDGFFQLYGPVETATMAVQLAAARGDEHARRLLLDDYRLSTMFFSTEAHDAEEYSIPARAILSYFTRLAAPLWNQSLFRIHQDGRRKDGAKMMSVLSAPLLEWFASSMEELGKFIESYVEEFRAVRFFDGTVFAPKCPNIVSEFELLFALRDIILRCAEILNLARIFEETTPVEVSARQMKTFTTKTFQSLVFTNDTPSAPMQGLISSILHGKDPEVQEAINFKMDNEIPQLCGAKDKIYRKALGLLKKAKTSPRLERQELLVSKAMHLLSDTSEERHMDAIIVALADLQRHYEVLQFVSKTAKKLVPEPATSDPEVQKKAHFLRRRCYDRVFSYVSDYIQNIDTDDDASLDIPVLYGAVQCLDDRHMMQMMMEKLLSSNKVPRRLLHHPSYTEFGKALREYIGQKVMNVSSLHDVKNRDGVPLSINAEKELRLLVAICQSQEEMKTAGDWLMVLAKRESVEGRPVPLIERIGDLNDAKAMYKTVMPESFMKQIEKEIEVAMFQQRVLTMGTRIFAIMNDGMDSGQDVRSVSTRLVDSETLFRVIQENFPDKVQTVKE